MVRAGSDTWLRLREEALSKLEEHRKQGRVDPDILQLLDAINSLEEYYTTSSCSGRIQVAACRHPGEKGKLRVLAKWHRPIEVYELEAVVEASNEENIWFSVHPPILHVVARDLPSARKLLVTARNNGFKHSGIQGLGKRIVVEIMSMEKIEAPLRLEGLPIVAVEAYPILVRTANELLLRGKGRLERLWKALLQE